MNAKTKTCLDLLGRSVIILIDIHYMLGGAFLSIFFPYRSFLNYLAAAIVGFIILWRYSCRGYSRSEIVWMTLILGTGMLYACVSDEFSLVISAMGIFAFMNVDRAGLFFDMFLEKLSFVIISVVCSIGKIIPTQSGSYERLYSFFGDGIVYRRSLGFRNYNTLGLMVFELMVLYVLLVNEKYKRRLKARE